MDMDALYGLTYVYGNAAGNESATNSIISRALFYEGLGHRPMAPASDWQEYDNMALVDLSALQTQQNQRIIELLQKIAAKK